MNGSSWKKLRVTAHDHNLVHDAQCGITVQTSMRNEDKILCEKCYQKVIYWHGI
ncbi:hypothetical protein HY732_04215 [Candidatus Uhrbacteria bacterium]|nr:hypothetical protein [Candidatus Uhrbacteria bacterium]